MQHLKTTNHKSERALLAVIHFKNEKDAWPKEDIVKELAELAKTARAYVVGEVFCALERPTADLFIGKGKAEEIALLCDDLEADTVIFSNDLSGTQQRNLEELIGKKTIDRTQLILDIFAHHARSPEGKTQVELAQLQYLLPRLVGKGIVLSRLGGGIGTTGPGETKLEVDRRRINKRIDKLKQDLKSLTAHRRLIRKKRHDEGLSSIVLVGYTNAGKSTLINALTGSEQPAKNSLFTTLDPLSRRLELSSGLKIIITDTVGFLQNLPHHLIDAFRATLEVVLEADLLINVLDVSHPRVGEHQKATIMVLKELNCKDKPLVSVLNKIDLLEDIAMKKWLSDKFPDSVSVSAKTGEDLDKLLEIIDDFFSIKYVEVVLEIPLKQMNIVNLLYRKARVNSVEYEVKATILSLSLSNDLLDNLLSNKELGITIRKADKNN